MQATHGAGPARTRHGHPANYVAGRGNRALQRQPEEEELMMRPLVQRELVQRNKYAKLDDDSDDGGQGSVAVLEEEEEEGDPLAEMEFGEDESLEINKDSIAFTFAGHTLNFQFDPKKGTAGVGYKHELSVPDDGPESEWAAIPLRYPIVPGIFLAGSIGIGGGANLEVSGNAKMTKDESIQPPYSGSIDSKNAAAASLFSFAKLGVSAGVPGLAEVEAGMKAQLAANTSADLNVEANDIIYQGGRLTTATGFHLLFELNQTDITGTIGLYVEAKLLGGLLSKGKEVELASKNFATFEGFKLEKTIGAYGNQSIDMTALQDALKAGPDLQADPASGQPVVDLMKNMFALPELKKYKSACTKARKAKATYQKSIGKKNLAKLDQANAAKAKELEQLAERLSEATNIRKLMKHAKTTKAAGNKYFQLPQAGEIEDDLMSIGTDITELISALEAEFGATGNELAKMMTLDNVEEIIEVLRSVGALELAITPDET